MIWLILSAAGCVVLGFGAFMVYVLIHYMPIIVKIFEEARIQAPLPMEQCVAGEKVSFPSKDGVPLTGIFVRGTSGNGKTIVFCHEYGSDMHSLGRYGSFLIAKGFNVFAFDFRGHGASSKANGYEPRQWVTDKETKDLLGAIDYLKSRPDVDASRLGLFGISRGAGAGICVASECEAVKAVVADGAFSTRLTLEQYMKKWVSIYAGVTFVYRNLPDWFYRILGWVCRKLVQRRTGCTFPSVERCARRLSPKPIYLIYGEKDNYVGLNQAQDLYGRARDPKQLWIVPRARHNESASVATQEYARNVSEFFERTL